MFGKFGQANGEFYFPFDVDSDNKMIIVADTFNHRLQIFDVNFNFNRSIGQEGTKKGEFTHPFSVSIFNDSLYVTDFNNKRVQRFSVEGKFLSTFSTDHNCYGLAVNSNYIHVSLCELHQIHTYSHSGALVKKWGMKGTAKSQFNFPSLTEPIMMVNMSLSGEVKGTRRDNSLVHKELQ